MKYLIIGNGVAGTTAAINIRKLDPDGEITLITYEPLPFYSRIRLIDYLSGEIDEKKLIIHNEDWHRQNRIELILNTSVKGIDTAKREIATSTGRTYKYDRLLISTGGSSFVPPIAGAEKPGVFALRNINDAREIIAYSENVLDVVLIGGGVLGLEAGNALRKRGKRVLVVEFFPRLLPRQMDPEGSGMLKGQMEDMGFSFFLDAKTREIKGGAKGEAVLLEDGREIKADMVIISAGIRANTALALSVGIGVGKKGILVDDRMKTSADGIYAAGDVAEHNGASYGIWPAAEKQGEVAGTNMAGGDALFKGITPSNILKVAGIDLLSAGNIDAEGKCECIVHAEKEKHIYGKLVIENDCLVGCIMLGAIAGRRKVLKAVEEKRNIKGIRVALDGWDLDVL